MSEQEAALLQAQLSGPPTVTASGTTKWVLVWAAGLALVTLAISAIVTFAPAPQAVFIALAALLGVVGLVCVFAIYLLITSHIHHQGVDRRSQQNDAPQIQAALLDASVQATRVSATAVVTIEQFEDEGSGYIYDVGDGKLLFIKGQDYYPAEDTMAWPNTEFEIVRTTIGRRWIGIFCHGAPLTPKKVLQTSDCKEHIVWAACEDIVHSSMRDFVRSIRRMPNQ